MSTLDALLLTQVQIEPKMNNQVQKGGSRKTRTDTHHSRAFTRGQSATKNDPLEDVPKMSHSSVRLENPH